MAVALSAPLWALVVLAGILLVAFWPVQGGWSQGAAGSLASSARSNAASICVSSSGKSTGFG